MLLCGHLLAPSGFLSLVMWRAYDAQWFRLFYEAVIKHHRQYLMEIIINNRRIKAYNQSCVLNMLKSNPFLNIRLDSNENNSDSKFDFDPWAVPLCDGSEPVQRP